MEQEGSPNPKIPIASPPVRERWSSRAAFYFAAIGAAVGFGNVWRFPSLVYEYGGGAFFLPYILALVFVGLPILVLEISLGQYYETGDVDVFGGINRRLRGVGLCSVACGYIGVTYYSMLLSWVAHAFFDSFGPGNIWGGDVTGSEAATYFEDRIIGMETLEPDAPLEATRVVWENVGYSAFTWAVVYLCIAFGIKWTGRITYFTMGLPIILLFVLLGRSVTLEGSREGIQQYLSSDWSVLADQPEVWTKAVTQTFFSLGINIGIMTAYGSHCRRDEPAFLNSCVIAAADSLFSFVAGFAVFGVLGYLAVLEGVSLDDLKVSGFGLVFGSWPVALGTLPGGEHWTRLLFLMLFLLGVDSAFCVVKGLHICIKDTVLLGNVRSAHISLGLVTAAWLFSFLYATDAGLFFMDVMDYYINFVLLLVGFAECFAAGWVYNIDEQVDNLGGSVVFSFMAATFGSILLACVLWVGIADSATAVWAGFVAWAVSYAFGMAFVCRLMHKQKMRHGLWSWRSMFYDLVLRNVMDLRDDLSGVVGYLPTAWAVLVKFFIPPILLVLFSLGCAARTATGEAEFGHYGGYPAVPYQLLGVSSVVFVGFLFFSSLVMPRLYEAFRKADSPVPSKDGTIVHAAPEMTERAATLSIADPREGVWPPRSINVQAANSASV